MRRGGARRLRGTDTVPMCLSSGTDRHWPEDIVTTSTSEAGDVDMENRTSEIVRDNLHPQPRVEVAELER